MSVKHTAQDIHKPEPVELPSGVLSAGKRDDPVKIARLLLDGKYVLVDDQFSTGLSILSELKKLLFEKSESSEFGEYREQRSAFQSASNKLLVCIRSNRIDLKKSPEIGWLSELYPELDTFYLPFPKVQGLNSSWQWFNNGIQYPGLPRKIHPWYGTYFPTRKDHIYLFNFWLRKYRGEKNHAIDIGSGCGVLAFLLLENSFERVTATDINPNAIVSIQKSSKEFGYDNRLEVIHSDLFEKLTDKTDLIVFNPPWLPAVKVDDFMDKAIYCEPTLFERFFTEAADYLNDGGKLVFLFSNLGLKEELIEVHPVEQELEKGNRFKKTKLIKRKADRPSGKTKRRDHREDEFVELWELEKV